VDEIQRRKNTGFTGKTKAKIEKYEAACRMVSAAFFAIIELLERSENVGTSIVFKQ
jgi:hypothetical protein